ncbi:hypothetical protein IFR05_005484 [Cadophora sp. M221]|nr:hypothetical protein IFR05_005484 [Cadophora sp. M221]
MTPVTGTAPAMERYNILPTLRLTSQSPFISRNNAVLVAQLQTSKIRPSFQSSTLVLHTDVQYPQAYQKPQWFIVESPAKHVGNADCGEQNVTPKDRLGRICNGYRDPADMMFRDESEGLNSKRQRAKASQSQKQRPAVTKPKATDEPQDLMNSVPGESQLSLLIPDVQMLPVISFGLTTPPEEQATCFFFQNYVLQQDMFSRGNFQYLSDIYGCEEIGAALADSVASLGLVGLAHFWGASNILANATTKYNSALKTVSTQLRTIEGAKSDQTIIAIMLLGLRHSMETWTRHITGASALLQLRGKEQLRTPIGYHLFIHLRTQVITNCIQRHAMIPAIISEWSQDLDFETAEQAAATTLANLAIRYCNLRASMSSFRDYSDPERIISTACALDMEYDIWARTCPLQYIYQTVTLSERSDEVFSDHYHVYSSIWIAAIWNNYRSARILVNELILDQLGYLYQTNPDLGLLWEDHCFYENQILTSNSTLLQLCHDICASVPYFLGYNPESQGFMEAPKSVNGNLLLWPLYTAGVTGMVSDVMRCWVAGRLQWITDVMGIRQAAPLAYSMVRRQDHLLWNPDSIESASSSDECGLVLDPSIEV